MLLKYWTVPLFLALSAALLATLPTGQVAGAASAAEQANNPPANYRGNPNVVCRDGLVINSKANKPLHDLEGQALTCND